MRGYAFRWFCVAAGSVLLGTSLSGQARTDEVSRDEPSNGQTHLGYPQDWSSRHLLMPGMRADDVLAASDRDPRHVYNVVMGQVAVDRFRHRERRPPRETKIDWAVSLENGYVPQNQFPG